ncbi:helix-turn-helix transcriptional regulator [Streptomyces sp. NPDC006333]|uniref:helix-turn-helix domain-containing protein n=1 Tax=Streptomyces sp. NPDC006333 TaxID=3156753 RepID=UPI0033A919CE
MRWNLRMVAARRGLWRPGEVLEAFRGAGFTASRSKVSALWRGVPVSVRLDDLDLICAALGCTVGDLLEPEPPAGNRTGAGRQDLSRGEARAGRARPVPRRGTDRPRSLPPN